MLSNWSNHGWDLKTPDETSQEGKVERSANDNGDYLRVFWARTSSCIFSPICVSAYYAAIWAWWLNSYDGNGPVSQGPAGARWVYYVWFVLSAVGIGMSKHGLAGVEAAMLMDQRWAPNNAMQLMAHCDKVSYVSRL